MIVIREELAMKNPKIKKAMTVLEFISSDKEAREHYEARQKEIRDKISQMMFAKEEGLKEGEHLKAVKMAKSMLSDGLDLSLISKYTQLELAELREIQSAQEKL